MCVHLVNALIDARKHHQRQLPDMGSDTVFTSEVWVPQQNMLRTLVNVLIDAKHHQQQWPDMDSDTVFISHVWVHQQNGLRTLVNALVGTRKTPEGAADDNIH